jgi:hypothetical protein
MTARRAEDRVLMHGGLVLSSTAAMGASPSVARGGAVTEGRSTVVERHVVRSFLLRSQLIQTALPAATAPRKASVINRAMVTVLAR